MKTRSALVLFFVIQQVSHNGIHSLCSYARVAYCLFCISTLILSISNLVLKLVEMIFSLKKSI